MIEQKSSQQNGKTVRTFAYILLFPYNFKTNSVFIYQRSVILEINDPRKARTYFRDSFSVKGICDLSDNVVLVYLCADFSHTYENSRRFGMYLCNV